MAHQCRFTLMWKADPGMVCHCFAACAGRDSTSPCFPPPNPQADTPVLQTAHALLLPSLDARNERAWAQRQGLRLPASYHPWEHAVIDAVEESLRSERSFPFSRPARTLERFGAPKAKLDWSVEHQLIAGNPEVLRLGGTGMQQLLPPPLCLQLPTTAGAAVASACAGAPSALSGDCSDGGGLASPPPHLLTLSSQASQASQHSLAQPFCGPGAAAAAGTADVHAEPLRSLGGGGSGVAATPSRGISTQLSHFPAPLSRAAGTAADAGAAGGSVELQITFSGLASQLVRATSSRQPAQLQGPSWRGPGAAVAAGAAGAAQPAHLAAVRDFAHSAEEGLWPLDDIRHFFRGVVAVLDPSAGRRARRCWRCLAAAAAAKAAAAAAAATGSRRKHPQMMPRSEGRQTASLHTAAR